MVPVLAWLVASNGWAVGCVRPRQTDTGARRCEWAGVWQTGAAGVAMSKEKLAGQDVPQWNVCSSPFAVTAYRTHEDFGGNDALICFREELASRGVRLVRSACCLL